MRFKFNPISKKINKYKISNGYLSVDAYIELSVFIVKIHLLSVSTSIYELPCIFVNDKKWFVLLFFNI